MDNLQKHNDYSYAHGNYCSAVEHLATGADRIQERLLGAFLQYLHAIQPNNVPDELLSDYQFVTDTLTSKPGRNKFEGAIHVTLASMGDETAMEVARRIVSLCHNIGVILEDMSL